ncbi:hypothetical protein [Nocardia sp. BMG51109]|nr:hypothetical protein [Nocardia sp. BMG51109]
MDCYTLVRDGGEEIGSRKTTSHDHPAGPALGSLRAWHERRYRSA